MLNATETLVIKGSDTLGAKMVPQLAEAFKAKMEQQGVDVAFEIAAEGSAQALHPLLMQLRKSACPHVTRRIKKSPKPGQGRRYESDHRSKRRHRHYR